MDAWTKGLTTWAVLLGLLAATAPAFQDDPADPYAPATAYERHEPSSTTAAATDQPVDRSINRSEAPLEDSYHTNQTNVSAVGSGQWVATFAINATGVANLTVSVDYEPRDGQPTWRTTFADFELVDPEGSRRWNGDAGGLGAPFGYPTSITFPGHEVPGGAWEFTLEWDGPTDVQVTLHAWAERGPSD